MTIAELIDALEKASGPNFALEQEIMALLEPERGQNKMLPANYTASLDAAVALCGRVLPGAELEMTNLYNVARVTIHHEDGQFYGSDACNRLPIALCIAILKAKQALEVQG